MHDTPYSTMNGFSGIEETAPVPGETCMTREVQHLLDWWFGAGDGRVRSRSDFDILDHVLLIPHISLTEVLADGTFRIKILGDELNQLIPRRRRGDIVAPDVPREDLWRLHDHFSWVTKHRMPLRCLGTLHFADRSHHRFEALDCPLAASDGTISHIAGVLRVVPPP